MCVHRTGFQKERDHQLQPRFLKEGIISVRVKIPHSGSAGTIDGSTCLKFDLRVIKQE